MKYKPGQLWGNILRGWVRSPAFVAEAAHRVVTPLGASRFLSTGHTIGPMTLLPPDPLHARDGHISHRLVVKPRTSRPRGFLWEIVREDGYARYQVSRSLGSYRSMEEAYNHGSVALDLVRFHGASASPD
jgi:hypothetical protein